MDRTDIRKILKNPSRDLINIALSYVNLTDRERQILEYVEMKGVTEEKTAEKLDISVRGLQQIKSEAFEKLNTVWSKNIFIALLLERG